MPLDECPRCDGDWILKKDGQFPEIHCEKCHTSYYHNPSTGASVLSLLHIIRLDDELAYYWGDTIYYDDRCRYITWRINKGKDIKLPLLPFTITAERLKVWLLLS